MSAKLPDELLDRKPRRVSQLNPGETGQIPFTELRVNPRGQCFIAAKAELCQPQFSTIEVSRDQQGRFHVVVPPYQRYIPRGLFVLYPFGIGLLPVTSVTVAPAAAGK
jgi:hypothetical protein